MNPTADPGGAMLAPLPALTPLTRARLAALEMRDDRVLRDFLLENLGRHLTRARDLYEALRSLEYALPRKGAEHLWAALSDRRKPSTVAEAADALHLRRGLTRNLLLHLCDWRYVEQVGPEDSPEAFRFRASRPLAHALAFLRKLLQPDEEGYDLKDTTRMYRGEASRFLSKAWLDGEGDRLALRVLARFTALADRALVRETLFLDTGELVHAAYRLIPGLSDLSLTIVAGDPSVKGGAAELISLEVPRGAYRSMDDTLLPQDLPEALGATITLSNSF